MSADLTASRWGVRVRARAVAARRGRIGRVAPPIWAQTATQSDPSSQGVGGVTQPRGAGGFSDVVFAPPAAGRAASLRLPTARGVVAHAWAREDATGALRSNATLPVGARGRVVFPGAAARGYDVLDATDAARAPIPLWRDGAATATALPKGVARVAADGDAVVVEIGAGFHQLTARVVAA